MFSFLFRFMMLGNRVSLLLLFLSCHVITVQCCIYDYTFWSTVFYLHYLFSYFLSYQHSTITFGIYLLPLQYLNVFDLRYPAIFLCDIFIFTNCELISWLLYWQMKNAYAVSRLRKKTGYTKKEFYDQAFKIYKEVHFLYLLGNQIYK